MRGTGPYYNKSYGGCSSRGPLGGHDDSNDIVGALANFLRNEGHGFHEMFEVDLLRGFVLQESVDKNKSNSGLFWAALTADVQPGSRVSSKVLESSVCVRV